MNNINNDTNNTHSYVLSDKGRGVVEHVSYETTSSPYSDSFQHQRRTRNERSQRMILASNEVDRGSANGAIHQVDDRVFTLTGSLAGIT